MAATKISEAPYDLTAIVDPDGLSPESPREIDINLRELPVGGHNQWAKAEQDSEYDQVICY